MRPKEMLTNPGITDEQKREFSFEEKQLMPQRLTAAYLEGRLPMDQYRELMDGIYTSPIRAMMIHQDCVDLKKIPLIGEKLAKEYHERAWAPIKQREWEGMMRADEALTRLRSGDN